MCKQLKSLTKSNLIPHTLTKFYGSDTPKCINPRMSGESCSGLQPRPHRVLSIQSHVIYGYVGNKVSIFPMQLLGIDVDAINSVQFTNDDGYKLVRGQILTDRVLGELMVALAENGIDYYTHLLTGYIGSESCLKRISAVVEQLKKRNANLIYLCDPVLGDNGKLYVPEELVQVYKASVLPLATILTPNMFEIEVLTDTKIKDVSDVWKAISVLHKRGCETIVVSSAELESNSNILLFASTVRDEKVERLSMEFEKLPVHFVGTGDLFASLFLSWMCKTSGNVKESLEKAIASLQAVLRRTMKSLEGLEVTPKNKELKLIQSKRDIEEPNIIYRARREP